MRTEPAALADDVARQSLDAQVALLPQALGLFGVSLPIFVWAGSFAANAGYMAASFAVFAINWGVFYAVVNWLKTEPAQDLKRRTRVHVLGAVLWAAAVCQLSAFAAGAGLAREPLLLMAAGAAVLCFFFAAPNLPSLLVSAPIAIAGPLIAAAADGETWHMGGLMWGAFALAFMLGLILNRNLRRQYELTAVAERLNADAESARDEAERLAASKSALVATLSHEIRNGLTGVTHVLAAAAGHGARAAPSREQLGQALSAANDLITVLNATLDSETAEAGRLAVDAAPFDPAPVVLDIASQLRPQAAAKGLELTVFVDPELEGRALGGAFADEARVRQVLAALLTNAVRYTVRGRVEARVELGAPDRLRIAIADTGPGFSADELAVAFEPFKRIERTAAGVPGAGLGLSLSRQLVRLMGAELTAESAVGVGSCFALELPYEPTAVLTEGGGSDEPRARKGLRVLLAEDDTLSQAAIRIVFEQLGHQVVHAGGGRRALDLMNAAPFDLVVLSAVLADLSGADAAAALRALPAPLSATPVIGLIGGDVEEATAFQAAGVESLLRKPVSVQSVARAVAEATAKPKTRRAKAAP